MFGVNLKVYATASRQSRHAHEETTVTMVLAGRVEEQSGGHVVHAGALSYVIKPRDTEHANVFGDNVRTLQIVIGSTLVDDLERWNRPLASWGWQHAGPSVPAFLGLLRARRECGDSAVERVQRATIDVLAALCLNGTEARGAAPPRWIAMLREAVDDSSRMPSVRALAAAARVHPVYLARQFRRWYGCSLTEYARRLRTRRAAHAITASAGDLSRASYAAGFTDHAHMCHVFKRETGLTPGAYRVLTSAPARARTRG